MGVGVRGAVIQGLHPFDVALRIKIAVEMTTLAVFCDDTIALIHGEVPVQGIIEGLGMTGGEAQERTQRAEDDPVFHGKAS
jgi:hypothetical protein